MVIRSIIAPTIFQTVPVTLIGEGPAGLLLFLLHERKHKAANTMNRFCIKNLPGHFPLRVVNIQHFLSVHTCNTFRRSMLDSFIVAA
jgi:hypothetical protein